MLWLKPDSFNIQKGSWALKCSEFFPLFMTTYQPFSKCLPDTCIFWIKCLDCDWTLGNRCILGFKAVFVLLRKGVSFDSPSLDISRDVGATDFFFFLILRSF